MRKIKYAAFFDISEKRGDKDAKPEEKAQQIAAENIKCLIHNSAEIRILSEKKPKRFFTAFSNAEAQSPKFYQNIYTYNIIENAGNVNY